MRRTGFLRQATCVAFLGLSLLALRAAAQTAASSDKIPITTSSDEARQLYLKGRDLAERLRATDAHRFYQQAVEKDGNFALAYVGLATTSGSTREFIEAATRAASLAGQVSEGERLIIRAIEAGLKGEPATVLASYTELVKRFPNDERAHTLLANTYFGRQDYETAVQHFTKATSINPSFSQPYNQLGYAYRFLERYDEAEKAFKTYTELIPNDPNPYDSYAELLMKMGRFDESIKMYEKALSIDRNFVASYIGIGNNYLAMGRPGEARTAFAKIATIARNTGERRTSHFWTAAAYVHEGATDKALSELKASYALADAEHDTGSMSGDLTQMADVLLEAGRPADALAKYNEALELVNKSQLPEEVKAATRRTHVFEEGRIAAVKKDVPRAKAKSAEYVRVIADRKRPFEVRQQHELAGMVALADKQYTQALQEFQQANQQDPRILYLAAVAAQGAGDAALASKLAERAAKFNGLSFNYAYVRNRAQKLATTSSLD
jgi:tetratricopeptide (TPR) repeat protein